MATVLVMIRSHKKTHPQSYLPQGTVITFSKHQTCTTRRALASRSIANSQLLEFGIGRSSMLPFLQMEHSHSQSTLHYHMGSSHECQSYFEVGGY